MLESIIIFLNKRTEPFHGIPFTLSMKEILGLLLILALLIILRSLGKRRKIGPGGEKIKTGGKPDITDEPLKKNLEETGRRSLYEAMKDDGAPAPVIPVMEKEIPKSPSPVPETPGDDSGLFHRLKSGLTKTRQSLSRRLDGIFSGNRRMDAAVLEEIEETLITSDIGVPTTMTLLAQISRQADQIASAEDFKRRLKDEMLSLLDVPQTKTHSEKPLVIMVVGVNGVGKTTTIGKLAAKFAVQGKKVLLAAADTFRAAAADQLDIWAKRANVDIVRHKDHSDPAAVAFDSVEAAIARGMDVVIIDTAGRLHTKVNLMEELKKIKRSIAKKLPFAPHETLLVVDATTGQNAVSQAKLFNADIGITGIVLTKLDGTAKGGIVLSICDLLKTPIRYIGVGEGIEDLQEFDPRLFVEALL